MSDTLAAKVGSHRYDEDFIMVVSRRELEIGLVYDSQALPGIKMTIYRRCYIHEFVHLDNMRKIYSHAVQHEAPNTVMDVRFYEARLWQADSEIEPTKKTLTN